MSMHRLLEKKTGKYPENEDSSKKETYVDIIGGFFSKGICKIWHLMSFFETKIIFRLFRLSDTNFVYSFYIDLIEDLSSRAQKIGTP